MVGEHRRETAIERREEEERKKENRRSEKREASREERKRNEKRREEERELRGGSNRGEKREHRFQQSDEPLKLELKLKLNSQTRKLVGSIG